MGFNCHLALIRQHKIAAQSAIINPDENDESLKPALWCGHCQALKPRDGQLPSSSTKMYFCQGGRQGEERVVAGVQHREHDKRELSLKKEILGVRMGFFFQWGGVLSRAVASYLAGSGTTKG
ncbi:hypothetical protein ACFX15_046492 [Malus domestica]